MSINSNSSVSFLVNGKIVKDCGSKNVLSFFTYSNSHEYDRSVVVDIDLPKSTGNSDSDSLKIIGHSHGIICLSDYLDDVFFCNPNTGEFRKLPQSIMFNKYSEAIAMGFGYDPRSNDFKVLRVMNFEDPPHHYHPSRVEIYDLSTDRWREIKTTVSGYFVDGFFEISHNRFYYSLAVDNNYDPIILSFDMTEEIFCTIPVPEGFPFLTSRFECPSRKFGVWKGSVVLFIFNNHDLTCHIWGINKDKSGWSKLLKICSVPGTLWPLMFVNSDEFLMIEPICDAIFSYNANTKEFKSVPKNWDSVGIQYCVFEKSLLSVKGGMILDLPHHKSCDRKTEILLEEDADVCDKC